MGHYDSCYESDANSSYEQQKDEAESRIRQKMHDMNLQELLFLAEVAENVASYVEVVSSLKRFAK